MFAKVFTSLWEGSMVGRADMQLVFVFLLAHCDRDGFVDIHPKVIAQLTGIQLERVRAALLELEEMDPESRSQDQGGARLERIDAHRAWGWRIVNHGKYRAMRDDDERRLANRLRMRDKRAHSAPLCATVRHGAPPCAHADTEAVEACTAPAKPAAVPTGPPATPEPSQSQRLFPDVVQPPEVVQGGPGVDVVIELPTNRRGQVYQVLGRQVNEWIGLYPAVDVMQMLRNMRGWLLANGTNRKTMDGTPRFIVKWLGEEQNKAARRTGRRFEDDRGMTAAGIEAFANHTEREERMNGQRQSG
ncbi:MAG TPA: hypothetical protein VIV56_07205 [Gemmatimonadales bacterium]